MYTYIHVYIHIYIYIYIYISVTKESGKKFDLMVFVDGIIIAGNLKENRRDCVEKLSKEFGLIDMYVI